MEPVVLLARKLFGDDNNDSDSKHICPTKDMSGPAIVPFVGTLTYHQFSVILSGACGIVSALIVGILIVLHACNYSNPVQQRQVIRILLLVPWVALFAFLIVWQEDAGEYLADSLDFGCSIALSAFLLFMCDLVLSHRGGFDNLFGEGAQGRGAFQDNSPVWLRRMWYSVLQFIPVSALCWVVTCITLATGSYCKQSNSIHFAHIWLSVIIIISATVAIISSIKFYGKNKKLLLQHRILLKLFTFKGIIGLNALQTFVIGILAGQNILKPTQHMTYHDVNTGLPSLILSCEMPIFAILIFIAFPVSPYKTDGPAAGPLNAIVDAFNISDILSAFVRGPMRLVRDQHRLILRQDSIRVAMNDEELQSQRSGVIKPQRSSNV